MSPLLMIRSATLVLLAGGVIGANAGLAQAAATPTDPQIAHIAYTAGLIDIANAKLAQQKTHNADVRAFADDMVRDHTAVNDKALALVKTLHVTPENNATSQSLVKQADAERATLSKLTGKAFDKAYVANEVAYHKAVDAALETTLIPAAQNAQLKALLKTALTIFEGHEQHAEHLDHMLQG